MDPLGRSEYFKNLALVLVCVGTSAGAIVTSIYRPLSPLESSLFSVISLAAGLYGSYGFGLQGARQVAQDLLKPAARSAFRRVLTLYSSLGRLSSRLDVLDRSRDPELAIASALLKEQLASASDVMEDWRDLVPEEVADIERRLAAGSQASGPSSENSR